METEMEFPVGDKTFDKVSELVSQKGIKLEPLVRLTSEKYPGSPNDLPEGLTGPGPNSVEINGLLTFKDQTSTFSLRRAEGKPGGLSVDVSDRNLLGANELVEALNAIFPTGSSLPSRILTTSAKSVGDQFGCLFIALVISACVFFFGYGVYRFFIPQRG